MAKKVEVEIEIKDKDTDKTKDKIGSLKQQIRETTQAMQKLELQGKATGAEYEKLREKLDGLNDAQDRAKFKAGQFEDRLASLPGPLGQLGGGLKTVGDSFATFGKTLTISLGVVGLLVAAFFSIKSALEKTKEGQQGLSKAMEAFNKVLSPIFAILEKVGNAVLPIVTKGFEALGNVMGKVAKFFGVTDAKIKEVQGTLQKDNEYKKNLDAEETARLKALQDKKDEQAKKDKERRDKEAKDREAAAEKEKQQREAELKAIMDGQKEAMLELLSEREKEEYKVNEHYSNLIFLATKHGEDTTQLKAAQAKALSDIDTKYKEKEAQKQKERLDKEKEFWKKLGEEVTKKRKEEYENGLKALDKEVTFIAMRNETLIQGTKAYFEGRLQLLNAQEKRELADKELTENQKLAIEKKYQKLRDDVKKDEATSNAMLVAATLQSFANLGSAIASSYDEEAKTSKAAFEKRKRLQKATAVMSAASGIIQILAQPSTLPSPFDWITKGINALALGVTTAIQIKNIDRTQFEGGGSGSSMGVVAPTFANAPTIPIPQIQTGGGMNPTQQIAETLNQSQRPIRAYVVSQDISTQQALDRRTNVAATFG